FLFREMMSGRIVIGKLRSTPGAYQKGLRFYLMPSRQPSGHFKAEGRTHAVAKQSKWLFLEHRKQIFRDGVGKLVDPSPRLLRQSGASTGKMDWKYLNEIRQSPRP